MRYLLEDFFTKPFTKFQHTLLVTGWAEMPSFARKCQQIFVAAVSIFDPCETVMQDAASLIAVNDLFDVGPEKTVFLTGLMPESRFDTFFQSLFFMQ